MSRTKQTAVETLYASSDFAVFFDDTLMNEFVINFTTSNYCNGTAGAASISFVFSEALYKIKNYNEDGSLKEEMHGIDYMTNVKIFIKNVVNGLYVMVFDGNLSGKNFNKDAEGNVSLSFSAEDYMHYLDKTVVPIAIPLDSKFISTSRIKWKSQGIDVNSTLVYQNESSRTLAGKNIRELLYESIGISLANNCFFSDKEGVSYWDAPTDRLKVMGDISDTLRKASIIDYIVTSDGTSVSSMYVMIGSIANSLMFEFFQDRDGIIRVKPPFWNEGILKDHIIMPSFISSYSETTDFTKMYTRVITQGSLDPALANSTEQMSVQSLPVGCYVAGDESQDGIWVSYTSTLDPDIAPDKVRDALATLMSSSPNTTTGTVYGTSAIPTGGSKPLSSATQGWRSSMVKYCDKWGLTPVLEIMMAVLQQESNGGAGISTNDIMQASECGFNTFKPNRIPTAEASLDIGCQNFRDCLIKSNGDVATALQSYNFGQGYATYVKDNGGVHTQSLALSFAARQQARYPESFPNGYGDPYYVAHVMQYVPSGSVTYYTPTTGTATGSTAAGLQIGTQNLANAAPQVTAALGLNYIQSVIFQNTMIRNADLSNRTQFSLPNFNASSANGLLGRNTLFTSGNSSFNPYMWGLDSSIINLLSKSQQDALSSANTISGIVGGNNGAGAVITGRCLGNGTVTENIYNIGTMNLANRQWHGIRAEKNGWVDCRAWSTSDLLIVARQYFGQPYKLVGATAKPGKILRDGHSQSEVVGWYGYDCASFVASVYSHFGIEIGKTVTGIDYDWGLGGLKVLPTAYESLAVGDLICYADHEHVVMYAGNGKIYHAPNFGQVVKEASFTKEDFRRAGVVSIRRPAIFRDSPGSGMSSAIGTSSNFPTISAGTFGSDGPGESTTGVSTDTRDDRDSRGVTVHGQTVAIKTILDQNMDIIAGRTNPESRASHTNFLAGTVVGADGTVRPTVAENLPVGSPYSKTSTRSVVNDSKTENALLWQSNSERKYGANILNVDQPLIRGFDNFKGITTKDGPAGSISDALRSYSIFMHGLTNGLVETATLVTTAPMPWIRCGMNVWVDPMGIDKIFYVHSIRHSGSAKEGIQTEISLGYGRSRQQYLYNENKFGSLRNNWKDNIFVSKMYQGFGIDAFGEVLNSKNAFTDLRKNIERNYEIAGIDGNPLTEPKSIENNKLYFDLYGGFSMDSSGKDDFGKVIDPKGEILVRATDGSIITGTAALNAYEAAKSAGAKPTLVEKAPTPIVGSSSSSSSEVKNWADGNNFPSNVSYEDKKCLTYLGWLETLPTMRYGDTSENVRKLQRIMYYLGIVIMDLGDLTGFFGPLTRRSVQVLQAEFDKSQTGVFTSNEANMLKGILKNLLTKTALSAYSSAISSSASKPSTSTSSGGVVSSLTTPDSPLFGPLQYKSADVFDYSGGKLGRGTKRLLLGSYSIKVIQDILKLNYSQANYVVRDRSENVRRAHSRAVSEIEKRSPMTKHNFN